MKNRIKNHNTIVGSGGAWKRLLVAAVILSSALVRLGASAPQLVSARAPSAPLPAGGNGDSVAATVSANGRYVLFVSSANNLVAGDNNQLGLDVFLRDRASNTTILVSANLSETGGGNGSSTFASVSTNGRYVVFESEANDLVPGDTNGVSDVFVRDLAAGTTRLVSVATNGGPGNGVSSEAVMTPDGRFVAFVSAASNLIPGDTNNIPDVFVRDLATGTTVWVSVGAYVQPGATTSVVSSVSITPEGRYVAYVSTARGLSPGATNNYGGEVYLRDLALGSTTWASTNGATIALSALGLAKAPSCHPGLSDDGRFVAFKSGSTNGTGVAAVLRYDAVAGTTTVVSTNGVPAGNFGDDVYGPELTPNGRFVAFAQRESPTSTLHASVRVWDAQTGTNILASGDGSGAVPTNSLSHTPTLTADGLRVCFLSDATNLVGNALSNGFHVYLRDLQATTTQLVDADTNGIGSIDTLGTIPSLSDDGGLIAFAGADGSLDGSNGNPFRDVFVRDLAGGTTELVSQRHATAPSQAGNGLSSASQFSLSDDGRWVAFGCFAGDLVTNDSNEAHDVFVRDVLSGTSFLVSAGVGGLAASGGESYTPMISGDGRFVVFVSGATNLVASPASGYLNIFRRDLQTGMNTLVSVSTNGVGAGTGDASAPIISRDGRYVAFLSKARNLAPGLGVGGPNTFWRDVNGGLTVALGANSSSPLPPSMSADGRYVAYTTSAQLRVWDTQQAADIYTVPLSVKSFVLSPTGTRLLYQTSSDLVAAVDWVGNSNLISSVSSKILLRNSAQWSADGRFFALVTATNLVPGSVDTNGTNDVYLCDTRNGAFTLVSINSSLTASGSGPSDWPVVSGNGQFVVYRSFAPDIVPGVTSIPGLYVFDRLTGSNSLLSLAKSVAGWSSWLAAPMISRDGKRATFGGWSSGEGSGDFNRVQDVFATIIDAATDSDGDGIPDWWTAQFFGHPTGQAGDLSRAQDDADGDGMTNLQEYLAGTDPTNLNSVFRIRLSHVASTNGVALSWPAAPGRYYRVQSKADLTDSAWSDAGGNIVVTGGEGSFSASANQSGRYYRVVGTN